MRKPIQICAVTDYTEGRTFEGAALPDTGLVALCDDGTIWCCWWGSEVWAKMDSIPQYEVSDGEAKASV